MITLFNLTNLAFWTSPTVQGTIGNTANYITSGLK